MALCSEIRTTCALLTLAFAVAWVACAPANALEAGAAKIEISPPVGTPLNGYGDRMGRDSLAKHDSLWARALYLDDGETRAFLVNADLCVINPMLRQRVLELAPDAVPRDHIILTATHTHSGPGAMVKRFPIRLVSGRFIPEILESTAHGIAEAMHDAYQARQRAAIGYGTTAQTVLSKNRRVPDGPIDEQIGVVSVEDADGEMIAVLANFAAHPTSVPDIDQYSISADYPGFYYDELERLANAGCVALFINGAQGNQTIGNPEGKSGWERTESVGRLLAVRVKGVANNIVCGDANIHVGYATPQLPPTLASFQPKEVFLQTLEINDLLLCFVPGEPCVEIGLELRRRSLERSYGAQFTVGLSNDYLMYFVPQKFYADSNYESGMNFFGPRVEDWFYREFSKLMTRGEPEPDPVLPPVAEKVEVPGGFKLTLRGTPYEMGAQRGQAFAEDIRSRYKERILDALETGALQPETGLWSKTPSFLDPTPVALPAMGMSARPLLQGLALGVFEEIEGLADGAGLPFDAAWLLQNAASFAEREDRTTLFNSPLMCTMFAAVGDRAGADGLLVGRNLDWPLDEIPVILEMHPAEGRAFLQVGFTWNAGAFTGMNDAGVVLCAERAESLGPLPQKGAPIEMVLREVLAEAANFDEALAMLRAKDHLRGFHVLTAGRDSEGAFKATVSEFGKTVAVRESTEGLLLGSDPDGYPVDEESAARHGRVLALLKEERILGKREIQRVLADAAPGKTEHAQIWNKATTHSVVFEPATRQVHVAFRDATGAPGEYTTVGLAGARP